MGKYERVRRLSVDPRMVREIQGSPQMSREQGPGFMQRWGGPNQYRAVAKMSEPTRVTYYAVADGNETVNDIMSVTELSRSEVTQSLKELGREDLVQEAPKI